MKIINDGNFTGLAICGLFLIGTILMCASLKWLPNYYLRSVGFSIGVATIAASGYAIRAKTWGLKPFDNSYKKARESYEQDKK
jgi:hypothetical protein